MAPLNDDPTPRFPAHRIAVGVPCFNEEARLPALLDAMRALDPAPGAILVLDDGSDDRTATLADADGVELLRHGANRGLAAARNTLWRRARERGYPFISFLDADVTPPPDWLELLGAVLAEDPRLAGVGGRNVDPLEDGGERPDQWRARFWRQDLGDAPLLDAPMLVGACATYRVDALQDIGGFDDTFRTNGEDVDVGRRLRAAGYRLRYEPSLMVKHRRRDGAGSLLRLCFRHCRDGMRATRKTPDELPGALELVVGMGRKTLTAPGAALLKRKDPLEAVLGAAACGAGLVGYGVGWLRG